MLANKTLSLVIPCKNEEQALASLLPKIPSFIDEIIIVDNNSSDSTKKVAQSLGAVVLDEKRHVNGIGYGYAHQKGLKAAKGDFVITMDGDGTYPLSAIPRVLSYMEKYDLDFVSCARFPLKNSKAVSPTRRLGVWILNTQSTLLFGKKINDILSGMWIVSKHAKKHLKISEGGWDLSPEIKLSALLNPKINFGEFHIHHSYRKGGESKQQIWKTGFGHLSFIAYYRFTTLFAKLKTKRQKNRSKQSFQWLPKPIESFVGPLLSK